MGDIIRESCNISIFLNLGGFKSLTGFDVIGDFIGDVYLVFFVDDLPPYEVGEVIYDVLPGIFCCRPPPLIRGQR